MPHSVTSVGESSGTFTSLPDAAGTRPVRLRRVSVVQAIVHSLLVIVVSAAFTRLLLKLPQRRTDPAPACGTSSSIYDAALGLYTAPVAYWFSSRKTDLA
jgi:hypothetical protein